MKSAAGRTLASNQRKEHLVNDASTSGRATSAGGELKAAGRPASRTATADLVWDVAQRCPELLSALTQRVPWVPGRLQEIRAAVPVATRVDPLNAGGCVRPYRHMRAFYEPRDDGVLAFKGTEIQADDRAEKLLELRSFRVDYSGRGRSFFSLTEHFPIVESKVPLAVSLAEALEDAESALSFQKAHLARFGALARAPVPLLVFRWPDAMVADFHAALSPLLSPRAAKIVDGVVSGGLGCLVYHYPTVPLRVAHLDVELGAEVAQAVDYRSRAQALKTAVDPASTIDGWVDLAARMMVLGFIPCSIESQGIGHCLEAQNAVIDGGFVDLGSMKPMDQVSDTRELYEALLSSLIDLARTVRGFLLGRLIDAEAEYRNPSIAMMFVGGQIWERMRRRLAAYDAESPLHPHLAQLLASESLFVELDQGLTHLYPAPWAKSQHART
jgi:hypothetical protein